MRIAETQEHRTMFASSMVEGLRKKLHPTTLHCQKYLLPEIVKNNHLVADTGSRSCCLNETMPTSFFPNHSTENGTLLTQLRGNPVEQCRRLQNFYPRRTGFCLFGKLVASRCE